MTHSSKLSGRDPFRSNIRPQRFRNHYAAVGLLVILDDRNPGAAYGQPTAVQRVHEFGLVLTLGSIANVGAPRLIRLEIRA